MILLVLPLLVVLVVLTLLLIPCARRHQQVLLPALPELDGAPLPGV